MTSRKFNPQCDLDKLTIPWATYHERRMKQQRPWAHEWRLIISNSMASLAQIVGENPRHVSCSNNNTEFEGGQQNPKQNMMGYSCMKAFYEYTRYLHSRKKVLFNLTRKPATRKKKWYKEIP